MTRLWGGRFDEEPADELLAFTESVSFDHVLVREDCRVLTAHARSLARAGIMTEAEAAAVAEALETIAEDILAGRFVPLDSDEDIHTTVERALLARTPGAGGKVRAGLSRNDRVAAALRLWLLREGSAVLRSLAVLIEVLAERAAEHASTIMPGYTHLQRAQPVTLGHHLLAHATALVRDADRFLDALGRTDASPLGAGALAGSTLGLDPVEAAADAGFSMVMPNSLDAVAARDFVAEFLAAAAIAGVHLSRLGEEITVWSSAEFGFARPADAYATGSSLMPQKKNPDIAELARGKAGRLIGNLTGLLATLKGLPLAYNRDLQEDKEPLFDTVRTLERMLPALAGMVRTLSFDVERMRAAVTPDALATDIAERLVREGTPFRDAHEQVGGMVARGDLGAAPSPEDSVAARGLPGPAGASLEQQLAGMREAVRRIRARTD